MAENSEGRGWHGDSKGHAEAGKKSHDGTSKEQGSGFYEKVDKQKDGDKNSGQFEKGSERAREAGKKGGEN